MEDRTCETCTYNEDGLCDKKGTLVEDEDSCEKHKNRINDLMFYKFLKGADA